MSEYLFEKVAGGVVTNSEVVDITEVPIQAPYWWSFTAGCRMTRVAEPVDCDVMGVVEVESYFSEALKNQRQNLPPTFKARV